MPTNKSGKFFLVLSGKKISPESENFLSRLARQNPAIAIRIVQVSSGKTAQVAAALRAGIRKGAREIYVLPMGTLPKRTVRDDIPLAVRQVREKNMAVDFHYMGSVIPACRKKS